MIEGHASTRIHRPASEVFAALTDITRTGEWSPECTGGRWVAPATGPALGATFEGDNIAKAGPVTLKRWTTTCEVTAFEPDKVFEFVAEGHTTWRYELAEHDGATTVTESYSHPPYAGWQKLVYGTLAQRGRAMVKGMHQTLATMKAVLEA
jgi:uncharacterized protein YndB with AHSA1/START domain